jgi:hypothetical protein
MRKIVSVLIVVSFLISLIPISLADDGIDHEHDKLDERRTDSIPISPENTRVLDSRQRDSNLETEKRVKINDGRVEVKERTRTDEGRVETRQRIDSKRLEIKDRFEERRKLNIEKLRDMDPEKLRRIEALSSVSVERIAGIVPEARDRLADLREKSLEKVANLDQVKLAKLGELKKDSLEKVSELDKDKLRRLASLNKEMLEKVSGLSKDSISKIAVFSRAEQERLVSMDRKDLDEQLKKIKIKAVKTADDLKERKVQSEDMLKARQRFDDAKNKFDDAKKKFSDARARFLSAKEEGNEGETLTNAKEFLLNSADSIISHLDRIIAKLDENENIGDEKAASLIERINLQSSEVQQIKESIVNAETKEDVRKAALDLKNKWRVLKHKAKAFSERVVTAKIQGVVNRAEVLERKIDSALAKMEEDGIDVNVEAEVEKFSSFVASARESYEQAKAKLAEARESDDVDAIKSLVDDGKLLLKESRDSLKSAHDSLKEIVKKIRDAGHELEIDDDEEVEVEDVEENEE